MEKVRELLLAYQKRLSDFKQFMHRGASTTELREVENHIGQALPDSLIHLLQVYNGEKKILNTMGFGFLSTQQVIQQWNFFVSSPADSSPDSVYHPELILPILFSNKRIPFAHDGSGNFLCIDNMPASQGTKGQIIYLPCGDPEPVSVLSKNFEEFIQFLIDSLESGRLALLDEREDLEEDEWDKAHIYFYKTWRDDWTVIADEYRTKSR